MVPENELVETGQAEILNFAYSICTQHDFGIPEAWNGLFSDFRQSTDLDKEKKK